MKKALSIILCFIILVSGVALPVDVYAQNGPSSWAEKYVTEARVNNLLTENIQKGYQTPVTREEFCELVVKLCETLFKEEYKLTKANPFSDTTNPEIRKAYELGIVTGVSANKFAPKNKITRQEIAVMLIKAITAVENRLNVKYISLNDEDIKGVNFKDESQIASWASKYIKASYKYNVMAGIGDNKMGPLADSTREMAIILSDRIYVIFNGIISGNKTAVTKENVQFIDTAQTENLNHSVKQATENTDGTTTLILSQSAAFVEGLKTNDIMLLAPSIKNKMGSAIKVISKSEQANGDYTLTVKRPQLEEVFDNFKINYSGAVKRDNIISANLPPGASILPEVAEEAPACKAVSVKSFDPPLLLAAGPGFDLSEILDSFKYSFTGDLSTRSNSFTIGFKDAVIYDKDGQKETSNDQILLNATVGLENVNCQIVADYSNMTDWKQMMLKISETQSFKSSISSKSSMGMSFSDLMKLKDKDYKSFNRVGMGDVINIEGVDMKDTLVIGSVVFDLSTMTVIPRLGEPQKMPFALVMMLTMNLEGEISATSTIGYEFSTYTENGLNIQKKGYIGQTGDISYNRGQESYQTTNYNVEVYNLKAASAAERNKAPQPEIYIESAGKYKLKFSAGPEFGIMIAGIMPVTAKAHPTYNLDCTLNGKISTKSKDKNSSGSSFVDHVSGSYDVLMQLGMIGQVRVALKIELDAIFVKLESGFTYTKDFPATLWTKSFSSENKLAEMVGTYDGTYTADQGVTGLTLDIYKIGENEAEAKFSFYPVSQNPRVASGQYLMTIKYNKAPDQYVLSGYKWLNQPATYSFVDLKGQCVNDLFKGYVYDGLDLSASTEKRIGEFSLKKRTVNPNGWKKAMEDEGAIMALRNDDKLIGIIKLDKENEKYMKELGFKIIKDNQVELLDNVKDFSLNHDRLVALKNDGSLWEFGRNNGSSEDTEILIKVMDHVKQVSSNGEFTLAIKDDGSLWGWGSNEYGALGVANKEYTNTPTKIMDGAEQIASDSLRTAVIKKDGSLWAFGRGIKNNYPTKISENMSSVSVGAEILAIGKDHSLWVWQRDMTEFYREGHKVMDNVDQAVAGSAIDLAIKKDGSLWTFNNNYLPLLGNGTNRFSPEPAKVMDNVSQVSTADSTVMAIKKDGTLWGWGRNEYGELGIGTNNLKSSPAKIMDKAVYVYVGAEHCVVAIKSDGSLWSWGNDDTELFGGDRSTPMQIDSGK